MELDGGERVVYNRLLVATGGRNRTLSVPGSNLEGIYQLRTVEDCDRIRAAAHPELLATRLNSDRWSCDTYPVMSIKSSPLRPSGP